MPFIQVTTRQPLSRETKAALAEALSTTMLEIEIGAPTDAALTRDWVWFKTLPSDDWAVGGKLDDSYVRGRSMAFARIIAPEGFLNTELKLQAIARVTSCLRAALAASPDDDGTGVWVHVVEVAEGQWGAAGSPDPLFRLIDGMHGHVSPERRQEMQAHFDGLRELRRAFAIPD